jgi:hypothetical protein
MLTGSVACCSRMPADPLATTAAGLAGGAAVSDRRPREFFFLEIRVAEAEVRLVVAAALLI